VDLYGIAERELGRLECSGDFGEPGLCGCVALSCKLDDLRLVCMRGYGNSGKGHFGMGRWKEAGKWGREGGRGTRKTSPSLFTIQFFSYIPIGLVKLYTKNKFNSNSRKTVHYLQLLDALEVHTGPYTEK